MSDVLPTAPGGAEQPACPGCGAPTHAGAAFCHKCGHPLGAGAPPPLAADPATTPAPSVFDAPPAAAPTVPPPFGRPAPEAPPRGTTLPGWGAPAQPPPGAGQPQPPSAWPYASPGAAPGGARGPSPYAAAYAPPPGGRSKVVAALLAFFLGGLGAHKFYLGRTGLGVLYLLFSWTLIPSLASLVDFIVLLATSDERFNARYGHLPGSGGVVVLLVAGGFFVLVAILGILAAIAIPNFLRYQLRSKASEVPAQLRALDQAEAARRELGEGYVVFAEGLPAGQDVGQAKVTWAGDDLAAIAELGWKPGPATWARYAVDGQEDEDGNQAIALCGETDLDGDGVRAAWVVFRPALAADGSMLVPPPPAPCSAGVALMEGASLEFDATRPPGAVVRLSPESVF